MKRTALNHYGTVVAKLIAWTTLALTLTLSQPERVQAQWTSNGNNDVHTTNSTSNVGIGRSDPQARLHVGASGTGTESQILFGDATATARYGIGRWDHNSLAVTGLFANNGYGGAAVSLGFDNSGTPFPALTVRPGGNVGIGTTAPAFRLDVIGSTRVGDGSQGQQIFFNTAHGGSALPGIGALSDNAAVNYLTFYTSGNEAVRINSAGNIGIGTTNPTTRLEVRNGYIGNTHDADSGRLLLGNVGRAVSGANFERLHLAFNSNVAQIYSDAAGTGTLRPIAFTAGAALTNGFYINTSGNVGIGTTVPTTRLHVEGDLTVTGNIAARYQDVAEWVAARGQLSAGTVVVLDPSEINQVMASAHSYDTRVAGVVSAQPGIILGEAGAGRVMVATTGRVRVRVDATRAPIRVGDLLVTSDTPGVAMRSVPLDLGGTQIHRPGTLIGKALEPLATGTGEILVLLSLQ